MIKDYSGVVYADLEAATSVVSTPRGAWSKG